MELDLDGRRAQVDVAGSGPPILLVHSLLTDAAAFEALVQPLALRRTVCRVSLPAFDGTAPLPDPSIEDLADFLAAVIEQLSLGTFEAVLGNGLGGFASVALAMRHGHLIDKLIAANCGAVFSPERAEAFGRMSRLVDEGGMDAVAEVAVARIFPEAYLAAHLDAAAERKNVLLRVDPGAFSAACRALAAMDLRPGLGAIRHPTLVVIGAEDQTTPSDMGRQLAAAIPDAREAVLSDCGHCPQLQQPADLLDAVTEFLDA